MKVVFMCLCEYPIKEVRKNKIKMGDKFVCPVHMRSISHYIFTCSRCEKEGISNSPSRLLCDECRGKNCVAFRKKPTKSKTESGKKQPERKTDCKHFVNRCLVPPNGILLKNTKACLTCTEYKPINREDEILKYL